MATNSRYQCSIDPPASTDRLNSYYRENVQLDPEESKRATAEVMGKMGKLIPLLNKEDNRFSWEAVLVGSTSQGLKVNRADEWDLNLKVKLEGNFGWIWKTTNGINVVQPYESSSSRPFPDKRYAKVRLYNGTDLKNFEDLMNVKGSDDLSSGIVKAQLHLIMHRALKKPGRPQASYRNTCNRCYVWD